MFLMIYVLNGKEIYSLMKRREEIIAKSHAEKDNIVSLDASSKFSFSMEAVLNQCSTVSLFGDRRVILLNDPYFLKASKGKSTEKKPSSHKKKEDEKDPSVMLRNYCENPNPDTDLIFFCDGYNAVKNTKEGKILSSYAQDKSRTVVTYITCDEPRPWEIEKRLDSECYARKLKLTSDAKQELLERAAGSMSEVYRTLDKLELYGKKEYDLKDIEHLSSTNAEVDIYKVGTKLIAGDKTGTIRAYQSLKENTQTPINALIPILASQIRGIYAVVRCDECGMYGEQITARTGRKYPDKDLQSARGHSSRWFLGMLNQLADLDQAIKTGKIHDKDATETAFEHFLLRNLQA